MPLQDIQDDQYIAKPSGDCCLKGSIHSGEPRGSFETIAGVETYVCKPRSGNAEDKIMLYFADVWGMFKNGLLIMDAFADAGYTTVGLDYFRGDPVWKHRKDRNDTTTDPGFDYEAWKRKHIAFADETVPTWVEAVKQKFGRPRTKYACVGYCFGAPYVCDQLASDTCAAGAFAHPAFLQDHHFTNLRQPLFLSCAEIDHTFPTESRNKAVDMMIARKQRYQVQLFQGVEHGFALRGNMENAYEKYAKEQSLKAIIEWCDFWIHNSS